MPLSRCSSASAIVPGSVNSYLCWPNTLAQNGTHAVVEAIRAEALFQSGDRCLDTAAERLVVEHGCDPGRESGRTGVLQLRQGAILVRPPSAGTKTGSPASTICATARPNCSAGCPRRPKSAAASSRATSLSLAFASTRMRASWPA